MNFVTFISLIVLAITAASLCCCCAAAAATDVMANTSYLRVHGTPPRPCTEPLGTLLWKKKFVDPKFFEPDFSDFSMSDGKLIVAAHLSAYAVDAVDGRILWNTTWERRVRKKAADVYRNKLTYFTTGTVGQEDVALRISDGKPQWTLNTYAPGGGWTGVPRVGLGLVFTFTTGSNGTLFACDAETGLVRWSKALKTETPCTYKADSGVSLFVERSTATLVLACWSAPASAVVFAVDGTSGKQLWRSPSTPIGYGMPAGVLCPRRSTNGRAVYSTLVAGYDRQWLLGFDYENGKLVFNETVPDSIGASKDGLTSYFLTLAASSDNGIFYNGPSWFYRADCATGKTVWRKSMSEITIPINGLTTPYVADSGRMLLIGGGNSFYALDAHTGKTLWNYTTGGQTWTDPLPASNRLFTASEDGYLYSFCLGPFASADNSKPDHMANYILAAVFSVLGVVVIILVVAMRRKKQQQQEMSAGGQYQADGGDYQNVA